MLFIVLYAVMALYYIGRYLYKRYLINKIKERLPDENITRVLCLPTLHFNQWRSLQLQNRRTTLAAPLKDKFSTTALKNRSLKANC